DAVGDAVAVAVGDLLLGAAVLVLDAVLVLGLVGALVELVGDAVLVVVRIRAAVLVLEAVAVLGLVGALVDVVLDAVAVAVADVGLEDDADEGAEVGVGGLVAEEAGAAAEQEEGVARQVELGGAQGLEGLVVDRVVERDRAGQLGDQVEALLHDRERDGGAEGDLVLRAHREPGRRLGRRVRRAAVPEGAVVAAQWEPDVAGDAAPPPLVVQDEREALDDLVLAEPGLLVVPGRDVDAAGDREADREVRGVEEADLG